MRHLAVLAACLALAAPAAAQSVYGCTDLSGRHAMPSVEGADGVFFRVDPDLMMFHPFAEETADDMAALSQALARRGTTLIYVPLPSKALAMPDHLPQAARDHGYDATLAATVYLDMIAELAGRGVIAVDARRALRTGRDAAPSFFAVDPRMTADGARRAAAAIAEIIAATPGYADLPRVRFATQDTGPVTLASDSRAILQRHCDVTLPEVTTPRFVTSRQGAASNDTGNAIFDAPAQGSGIALLGTDYGGEPAINLAGFLAEATGLDVAHYAVPDGGAYAAISAYLTSQAFQDQPPAYLVWANPMFEPLAERGDQPMAELIAAAGGDCRIALPLAPGRVPGSVTADLRGLDPGQDYTLYLDADARMGAEARFDFTGPDGTVRGRSIHRHPDQIATGRYYMPMTGLWDAGAVSVDITLDAGFGLNPRMAACAVAPAGGPE